jgi:8-oxo-dGTP diphosphatase
MTEVPRIGVGVFVIRPDGHFIIGQRNDKASLGYGIFPSIFPWFLTVFSNMITATYAIPGGHLEMHESFEECAARELLEETGINVPSKQFHFLTAVNTSFYESGKHYATMFMGVVVPEDADPRVCVLICDEEVLLTTRCSYWSRTNAQDGVG